MKPLWLILALACSAALANGTAEGNGTALTNVTAPATTPVPAVRPLYFEHLTMRDGLSQSTVMSFLQDSQGYLWLGTESGLDRYDGYSIREYRRQRGNASGLASDYIWAIAEDSHSNLWLATDGGGVEHWDRGTDSFQHYKHDPKDSRTLASDGVRTLLIDAQGRVWAGTLDQGLDILDPQTGAIRHFRHRDADPHSIPADAVCVLYTDHTGRIWVGTDGGLSQYQPATDDFVSYGDRATGTVFTDVHVRTIREDHTGALWVGTLGGGVNRFQILESLVHERHDFGRSRIGALRDLGEAGAAQQIWKPPVSSQAI